MATVNFLYRSTKDKAPLNVRLLYRYDDKDFVIGGKTKFEVTKTYWSKQHKQKRPKDIQIANRQTEVNQELNKLENHILNAFDGVDPLTVDKEWLQLQIENYYNPPQKEEEVIPTRLTEYIDFYIDYRRHELKPTSVKRFRVIQNKLIRFQEYRKKPILIKEVNDTFKNSLVDYLKSQNYSQNTISRDLGFIKSFCVHARFLGLETHAQLDSLRLEKEKVEKISLSFRDLEKIEATRNLPDYLENAKDWLIISCYTGQRISDFMRFTDEMIRIEDGKYLLEFTQKKTDKDMTVPLHKKVLEILDKRKGKFPHSISDQRYNDYIKEVCKAAKITTRTKGSKLIEVKPGEYRKQTGTFEKWELVTSHIGRRSFATNFYNKLTVTELTYITGHSTEAMFLKYVGKNNKNLALGISFD